MSRQQPAAGLIIIIIACLVTGWFGFERAWRGEAPGTWARTQGAIERTAVVATSWPGKSNSTVGGSFVYKVDGKTYRSSRFTYNSRHYDGSINHREFVKRHPPGTSVPVHYKLENPADAGLMLPPPASEGYWIALTSWGFAALAIAALVARRKPRSPQPFDERKPRFRYRL